MNIVEVIDEVKEICGGGRAYLIPVTAIQQLKYLLEWLI